MISSTAKAQIDYVAVHDVAGGVTTIPLADADCIIINGNYFTIGSFSLDIQNLKKYEFVDSSTSGINDVIGDISDFRFNSDGKIIIPTRMIGKPVNVYLLSGLKCEVSTHGNIIDMHKLATGIYLVKVGETSFKFKKK